MKKKKKIPKFLDLTDDKAKKFWKFHCQNLHVYREFKRLALKMKKAGRKKYSIGTIYEVVRWHSELKTTGKIFKLSNNHRPFYARLLMERVPELENFFNVKESKGTL